MTSAPLQYQSDSLSSSMWNHETFRQCLLPYSTFLSITCTVSCDSRRGDDGAYPSLAQ